MAPHFETADWPPLDVGTRLIRVFAWLGKAKFTHGAIVIVRNHKAEILLVQERLRERGDWGLPGGFMKLRESPRSAAARELHEEVGIGVDADKLTTIDEYRQPWAWHYDHLYGLRAEPDQAIGGRSREIGALAWYSRDALPKLTRATGYALDRWDWES